MTTLSTGCSTDAAAFTSIAEFTAAARRRLPPAARAFLFGGAERESTARRTRRAFAEIELRPRVLVDVSAIDLGTELLGVRLRAPILLAPIGLQGLLHPDGERETARGAVDTIFVVSTAGSASMEDVAAVAVGPLWFQLYAQRDEALTRDLMARAEAAGYRAIVLTVDMPRVGPRDRQRRAGIDLSAFHYPNLAPAPMSISPSLTWEDVRRLRAGTRLPFVIKGILTPDDALRAREAGADAIVVSNHGGRNLDSLPVAIQALPVVAATVGGSMRVLVDGGIRRGTDVLKALALGADVVMIGRPYVCALCVGGASGVRRVQELLAAELEAAMALIGRVAIRDLDDTAIWSRAAR